MTKARDLANASTALSAVSATELGYLDGVTSAVQTQLNAKQPTVSGVSDTEIGYLDGVTSAIQTQLDSKVSTAGGSVISANSTGNALEIRQTGTGNALVIEDDANPDATPFVVSATGNVGIGIAPNASTKLQAKIATDQVFALYNGTFGPNSVGIASVNDAYSAYAPLDLLGSSVQIGTAGVERLRINSSGATTVTNTNTTNPAVRNIYMSTSDPSGGSDGDVWIKYT